MRPIDGSIIRRFAEEFAFGKKGFSLIQISPYFANYEKSVPSPEEGYATPTKIGHFVTCVNSLSPKNQRYALFDLCDDPPEMKGLVPSVNIRKELLHQLVQGDGVSPLAVKLSSITLRGIRNDWFTAASRITSTPSSAITAARALLESTCKTILTELKENPVSGGNLPKLFKQTRKAIGIDTVKNVSQEVTQLITGLTSVVDGFSALSNKAGDRHGLAGGTEIRNQTIASIVVHTSGTLSLFLCQTYKDKQRLKNS